MPDTRLRQRAPMAVIKLARRALANTPVHRLPVVSWLYRKTVRMAWGSGEITAQFRGLRLTVPGGEHVLASGLIGGYYESIELDLLERLARASRTIVDVGANIGIHACVGASHLPAGGRLIAFEPVPDNLVALRRNIAQNEFPAEIQVEELAVGEAADEMVIHLAPASINHSLASGVVAHSRATVPVRVTSLDDYVAGLNPPATVDVLKIDVEGYDGYALRGAATLLKEHRPTLLIEFVPSDLVKAGFTPAEFVDLVFVAYPHVYVIDEPRRELRPCNQEDLARYGAKSLNLNLLAVVRPEHREIVESYLGALK
jgi:FkbM family methyltransferase